MAIRSNVGDLRGMMMAVQATLHHMTSTDDRLVHHMCPEGENSWCSYNKAKPCNELDEYKHGFDPIPQAIVQLLKSIYNRLGSRLLLFLCLLGHTQNANESLHSTKCGDSSVPNTCFFGPRLVKIGCALAVCTWNDGCSSLHGLVQRLELQPTLSSLHVLQAQNLEQLSRSVYKESSSAKLLKKACRRKRKGNEANNEAQEGGKMYVVGEFGEHGPDVTICPPCKKRRM